MKKFLTLALSLIMAMAMSVPVFANETVAEQPSGDVITTEAPAAEPTTEPTTEPTAEPTQPSTEPTTQSTEVTKSEALSIALKDAKTSKSKVKRLDVELERGVYEIEFTKKSNGYEYDYDIVKATGVIKEKSVDVKYKKTTSKKKVGKTKAVAKVAKHSKVSKSIIKSGSFSYKRDDRQGEYKIKFKANGKKYEYELQAATGKIIEYSWKMY